MEEKFTLLLYEKEKAFKVIKVAFYGDGGFRNFAPYHTVKKGLLSKLEVDYSLGKQYISRNENVEYTADDKVKLSIHPDGFVQFSGVKGNITTDITKIESNSICSA
ncbi:MAG: hypothetical protein K0Q49_2151 [Haloplasmataceae bacterium]|jgi:allantoicase|nr:hypothetical protein [Haloplasmataceae bacterium]